MVKFLRGRVFLGCVVLTSLVTLAACGDGDVEGGGMRSAATGREQLSYQLLTEADAGPDVIVAAIFWVDIGLPDQRGTVIRLSGNDSSTMRWRMAQAPDPFLMEWAKIDGRLAFETDGLLGDPSTAAKEVELRGNVEGETSVVFELVERDPALRTSEPAKRLEYIFQVVGKQDVIPGGAVGGGGLQCGSFGSC